MFDADFRLIVTKPTMCRSSACFSWFRSSPGSPCAKPCATIKRIAEGKPLIEQEETAEKVLTWPDLVYTELICMVVLTVILIGWSMAAEGAARRTRKPVSFAESVESAVVLPWPAGNARVLRSVAGRRRVSRA